MMSALIKGAKGLTDAEETDTSGIVEANETSASSFSEQGVKTGTKSFLVWTHTNQQLLTPRSVF